MSECTNCNHTGWVYEEIGKEPDPCSAPDPNEGRPIKGRTLTGAGWVVEYETTEETEHREEMESRAARRKEVARQKRQEAARKRRYEKYIELKAEFGQYEEYMELKEEFDDGK